MGKMTKWFSDVMDKTPIAAIYLFGVIAFGVLLISMSIPACNTDLARQIELNRLQDTIEIQRLEVTRDSLKLVLDSLDRELGK